MSEPEPIAHPLKWGQRVMKDMPLEMILRHLSLNELYRLSWGAKNAHGPEWETLRSEFDARLERMSKQALREKWLQPQGVYGLFPCQSDGDELVVYNPDTIDTASPDELTRFTFPRQPYDDHLCLADYFAPVESGKMDVVAFQVVTVGREATERFDRLQAKGDYSEAYFTHGLAVQTAEATADYLHAHVRRELGIRETRANVTRGAILRFRSWKTIRRFSNLLPAVSTELGMRLSAAYQLIPEQSTAAIIVHHKDARYYSVGESRVEQLMK